MRVLNRVICILFLIFSLTSHAEQAPDPFKSGMWDYVKSKYIGESPYVFDERVRVNGPEFAENSSQVPILIDASELDVKFIQKIIVFVDFNPISHILTFTPRKNIKPTFSTKIKLQQPSPVRAAVLDSNGVWHIGGSFIRTSGGGCTTPPDISSEKSLASLLKIKTYIVQNTESTKIKLKTFHPMNTGLSLGAYKFHINNLEIFDEDKELIAQISLTAAVSQDPIFSFVSDEINKKYTIKIKDSKGNEAFKNITAK
ncbi:MAG: sulfur-oxidizing protein SoxY [Oceanospirillaceae bacterium]|jgi:sulfur-oxidizing protein SoxY